MYIVCIYILGDTSPWGIHPPYPLFQVGRAQYLILNKDVSSIYHLWNGGGKGEPLGSPNGGGKGEPLGSPNGGGKGEPLGSPYL